MRRKRGHAPSARPRSAYARAGPGEAWPRLNEDEVLEADPDDVSVDDRRHARMHKHNNKVGYDYIMAVSKRENHNDRFYCSISAGKPPARRRRASGATPRFRASWRATG